MSAARRGLLVPSIATLIALAILLALGTWQLQRKTWKEDLIETLTRRLGAPPIDLPPPSQWASLRQDKDEFTRVKLRAEYLQDKDAVVWATGSGLRDDVNGPGIFVFTPAVVTPGATVVINRGYIADQKPTGATKRPPAVAGPVEITGILRWPEPKGWELTTPFDKGAQLWFVRDQMAMAREYGWQNVAPFYIERDGQQPADGIAPPGPFKAQLPNNHLQYAVTWYGLALVLIGVFGFWIRSRGRPPQDNT
jgi:surfeit locus 1 family protein